MKTRCTFYCLFSMLSLAVCTFSLYAAPEVIRTPYGMLTLPTEFMYQRTGIPDASKGEIQRRDGSFKIQFHIGKMPGALMDQAQQATCSYYRVHTIAGTPVATGIQTHNGVKTITSTFHDKKTAPANFWAAINNEADLADFLIVISGYKPGMDHTLQKKNP